MSAFGDHTPKQDVLDAVRMVQDDHNLSVYELIKLMAEIISYLIDYCSEE